MLCDRNHQRHNSASSASLFLLAENLLLSDILRTNYFAIWTRAWMKRPNVNVGILCGPSDSLAHRIVHVSQRIAVIFWGDILIDSDWFITFLIHNILVKRNLRLQLCPRQNPSRTTWFLQSLRCNVRSRHCVAVETRGVAAVAEEDSGVVVPACVLSSDRTEILDLGF